jgi:hypothetical protein
VQLGESQKTGKRVLEEEWIREKKVLYLLREEICIGGNSSIHEILLTWSSWILHIVSTIGTALTISLPNGNQCMQWVLLLFVRQSGVQETECFEDKRVKSLIEIICMICSFLVYSAKVDGAGIKKT